MQCLIVVCLLIVELFARVDTSSDGFCRKTEEGVHCDSLENINLTRLTGQTGETVTTTLGDGTVLAISTLSNKPLIFEIPHFLSDEECDHFIEVAKQQGMEKSQTSSHGGNKFQLFDINKDKLLDIREMQMTIENSFDIYLEEEDVFAMYDAIDMDTNGDKYISPDEIGKIQPKDLEKYLKSYVSEHPAKHSRYSNQTWLFPDQSYDEVFVKVQQRVSMVTQLPLDLIKLSDFQVVNYGVSGHYNAHLDSSKFDELTPCCDRGRQRFCRICRYMTVLFYLNDVEGGGETAFPVANNETLDMSKIKFERMEHLYKRCSDANLRVSAEKGKAIIWYNHQLNNQTGWMGDVDHYTLHGGCPVTQGEKWIANFWVKTSEDKKADLKKIKKLYEKTVQRDEL